MHRFILRNGNTILVSRLSQLGNASSEGQASRPRPNLEGDSTALYLGEQLSNRGVKVTRLARRLPSGSQLEYASKAVLADAIQGRQQMGQTPVE